MTAPQATRKTSVLLAALGAAGVAAVVAVLGSEPVTDEIFQNDVQWLRETAGPLSWRVSADGAPTDAWIAGNLVALLYAPVAFFFLAVATWRRDRWSFGSIWMGAWGAIVAAGATVGFIHFVFVELFEPYGQFGPYPPGFSGLDSLHYATRIASFTGAAIGLWVGLGVAIVSVLVGRGTPRATSSGFAPPNGPMPPPAAPSPAEPWDQPTGVQPSVETGANPPHPEDPPPAPATPPPPHEAPTEVQPAVWPPPPPSPPSSGA